LGARRTGGCWLASPHSSPCLPQAAGIISLCLKIACEIFWTVFFYSECNHWLFLGLILVEINYFI
jgi:hypothetical protein